MNVSDPETSGYNEIHLKGLIVKPIIIKQKIQQ